MADLLSTTPNATQRNIAGFLFFQKNFHRVSTETEAREADALVAEVQDTLRTRISMLLRMQDKAFEASFETPSLQGYGRQGMEAMRQRAKLRGIANEHKEAQTPHAQGTVAELATKLGVSKSEVRRLKQEGGLDEALAKLAQGAQNV